MISRTERDELRIETSLEFDYVFSDRYAERPDVYQTIARNSERVRKARHLLADLKYGDHARERLDLFPGEADAPLLVFIHGGYWRGMEKASFSYVAAPFLERGFSVAILTYPLAPDLPMLRIVQSVRNAVLWLANDGSAYLPGASRFYLCGHSAGGHLAAMACMTDWQQVIEQQETAAGRRKNSVQPPPIAGCIPLSGLFDLLPLTKTSIAANVDLSVETAKSLSPMTLTACPTTLNSMWLLAAVGVDETASFKNQTARYAEHWSASIGPSSTLYLSNVNHYTILLELNYSDSMLVNAMCARIMPMGKDLHPAAIQSPHDKNER